MRRADQITGIVMLIFSLTVAYTSWQMPQRVEFGPGMGFLPFWLAVLMAVLSVLLLFDATVRKRGSAGKNPFPAPQALLNVGMVIAGLGVFVAVLETVGFAVSTIVYIAFLLAIVQKERWLKTAIVALLSTGGLYFVFQILLEVKLPKNIFGF
ncbi:MAG: tripartite tricarboxylate transporter TctB family protein [Desulfobacterales bacterium]|nr:tripartite tricarboxylate transporter TctB family protein [Desulfobacterales bacterium]